MPSSSDLATIGAIRRAARRQAAEVLDRYWSPAVIPVDPVVIARRLGLSVFSAELGEEVWGMLASGTAGSDIYLDRDQPPNRYRFSCAHELGHFIDRGGELTPGEAFVDRRSDDSVGRADEVFANEFAGSLLMPEQAFRRAARSLDDFDLASHFDVSLDSVRYR
jgi:Zn-dependent peptidase ImmA (M78 family)